MSQRRLLLLTLARARRLRKYLPSVLALVLAVPPPEPRVVDMSCWRIGGPRGFRTGLGDCDSGLEPGSDEDEDAERSVDGWTMVSEDDEVEGSDHDHDWDWVFVRNGYVEVNTAAKSSGSAASLSREGDQGYDHKDCDDDGDGDGGHAIDGLSEMNLREAYRGSGSDSDSGESQHRSQSQLQPWLRPLYQAPPMLHHSGCDASYPLSMRIGRVANFSVARQGQTHAAKQDWRQRTVVVETLPGPVGRVDSRVSEGDS